MLVAFCCLAARLRIAVFYIMLPATVRPLARGMELYKTSWHENSVSPLVVECFL